MRYLMSVPKYLVFLINFLIVICSILLIVFGALLLLKGNISSGYSGSVICIGVIVLLVAFFGCCGVIREDTRMLTIYGFILIILFIIQIILAIVLFVKVSNDVGTQREAETFLKDRFKLHDTTLFDHLQKTLKCCGIKSSNEYGDDIPDSCYPNEDHLKPVFSKGCTSALYDYTVEGFKIIAEVSIGFGVIELVGACLTFLLRNNIRRKCVYP